MARTPAMIGRRGALILATLLASPRLAGAADQPWLRLPPTPALPPPSHTGLAAINGVRIWYAIYEPHTPPSGDPVILLHGGLANSDYWGLQIAALAPDHRVIVMDSRGHGRSTRNLRPIGYDLMASDVLALMDMLHIPRAAIVGWSDGAIVGLDIAINHPDRVSRLFAFAANSDPSGVNDIGQSPVFTAYMARAAKEYHQLSPTPAAFSMFVNDVDRMWATQPHFTDDELRGITVPTWIVDGEHDEAIKRENTDHMAELIPGVRELILANTSHFAFLQDPDGFNAALRLFLAGE